MAAVQFANINTRMMNIALNHSFDPVGHGDQGPGSARRKKDCCYALGMQAGAPNLGAAMQYDYGPGNFQHGVMYSNDEAHIFINATDMHTGSGDVVGMGHYGDGFVRISAPDGPHPRDPVCMGWKGAKTFNYDFANRTFRLFGRMSSIKQVRYLGKMRLMEFTQRVDDNAPARAWFQLEDVTGANMSILPARH